MLFYTRIPSIYVSTPRPMIVSYSEYIEWNYFIKTLLFVTKSRRPQFIYPKFLFVRLALSYFHGTCDIVGFNDLST